MRGRPPLATLEQRRRVYELAEAGESSRAIAEQVFGSRRLKNRVLRLLARRRLTTVAGVDVETATLEELDALFDGTLAELERAQLGQAWPPRRRRRSR